MKTVQGDLFDYPVVVIPTCAVVRGIELVMGAGLAKRALVEEPKLSVVFGAMIRASGLQTHAVQPRPDDRTYVSFPTKYHYRDPSDLQLIEQSTVELVRLREVFGWEVVALPRVGCGLGRRDWLTEVRPILDRYLDDRFVVVEWKT